METIVLLTKLPDYQADLIFLSTFYTRSGSVKVQPPSTLEKNRRKKPLLHVLLSSVFALSYGTLGRKANGERPQYFSFWMIT